jgi:hypothetical protein
MKPNKIEPRQHRGALAAAAMIGAAAVFTVLAIGYGKLRDLWLEQCRITDFAEQVSITPGKMVKADVVAMELSLTNGANLSLIDFKAKRRDILRKIPNLRSISISRRLPNRIVVETEERTPIARLSTDKRRSETGKVVDSEGMVFICQRGTQTLPLIREPHEPGTRPGARLTGRSLAALKFVETCKETDFADLQVQEVKLSNRSYLFATLGNYSCAKIAWDGMDDPNESNRKNLLRQLRMLSKAVRSGATPGSTTWNATDTSTPGRIYAEVKTSP